MKKYLVVLVAVFALVVSGCSLKGGTKTLKCTKDISESGIKMVQTVNANFVNDKVETLDTTVLITLTEAQKPYMDTFINALKNQYDTQYGKYSHVDIKTEKTSDTEILVTVSFDYKKMTSDEKSGLDLVGSEKYVNNKKTLEKEGFKCE